VASSILGPFKTSVHTKYFPNKPTSSNVKRMVVELSDTDARSSLDYGFYEDLLTQYVSLNRTPKPDLHASPAKQPRSLQNSIKRLVSKSSQMFRKDSVASRKDKPEPTQVEKYTDINTPYRNVLLAYCRIRKPICLKCLCRM
jgi:hypothetical protein